MELDLLKRPMTNDEKEVHAIYLALKAMAVREDLPPCVARNIRKALACLWQATNNLDLQFEQLYHLGV